VVAVVTPHSKNRRVVTILDTDVPNGSGLGLVAMIEVAALMVGDIVQRYSTERYLDAQPVRRNMFLRRGAPKSLFRPGGSTVVLLFQSGRIAFAEDIVANTLRTDVESRFSLGFGRPLVETDVMVRSPLAKAVGRR
jgi:phosphatidylserine decarboxylase